MTNAGQNGREYGFWWLWRRFSARRIVRNPLRIAFVLLSIALATTLWSAVARVTLAGIKSFEQGVAGGDRPYHLTIAPVGGRLKIDQFSSCLSSLAPFSEVIGVRREAGLISLGSSLPIPVRVAAISAWSTEGSLSNQSEIAASGELISKLTFKTNEPAKLIIAGSTHLVKLKSDPSTNSLLLDSDLVVPISWLPGEVVLDSIAIRLLKGDLIESRQAALSWLSGCVDRSVPIRIEQITAPIERGERLLAAYRLNVAIMAGITLVVCALLISQATRLALRNLGRELSILRTLGVSRARCLILIVSEATALSAIGALIGLTLGYPVVLRLSSFLTETASEIYHVSLQPKDLATQLGYGAIIWLGMVLLGFCAALIGAREALGIAPYRGARREQVHYTPLSRPAAYTMAMCASLFCGATLLGLILRPSTWLAYLNLLALLNLAAMLVPLTLLVAPKVLRGIRGALPVRLACSSLAASGRVFVLSAIAASVAITLIVGLSVMVESFRATLRSWSDVRLSGDLFVSATLGGKGNESRIDPKIVERIESIRGIAQVVPYYETASEVGSKAVVVGGTALALQCKRGVYIFTKGGCLASDGDWRSKAIVSEGAARRLGVSQGSIVSLDSQDYYVFGVIQEFGTEQPLIIIDHSDFQRRYQGHHPQTLTIDLIAGADRDTARTEINSLAPGLLIVRDHAQLSELVETLFNRTFRVTDTVRWIVFSMALLGLLSTLAQQIWERRRELKVVQVLGVSRPIFTLALVIELFVSSIAAVAIGVIVGIGLGWCLIRYINPLVFGWSLSFGLSGSVFLEALLFLAILLAIGCLVTVSILSLVSRAIKLADE